MRMKQAFRAAARFRGDPHLFGYTLGKALLDPAYHKVALELRCSELPLLDVGCGAGHLAAYLRADGYSAPIRGIDLDRKKITAAVRFLQKAGCEFWLGSAEKMPMHQGHVTALDVIHYLREGDQPLFVSEVAARLAPGGKAFLRMTLRDTSLRFWLTQREEKFIRRTGWIPWEGEFFPRREEVQNWAERTGCDWQLAPLWGVTPFNSYLLRLERPRR